VAVSGHPGCMRQHELQVQVLYNVFIIIIQYLLYSYDSSLGEDYIFYRMISSFFLIAIAYEKAPLEDCAFIFQPRIYRQAL
jgi:hypothetical protein